MQSITTSSNNSTLRKSLEKVEKIIAALFIVTDSIEHNDLVKLRVREICLDILSFMNSMDLDGELSPLIARQMSPVKCFIDEIHSILNVSRMSGLISEMNYQILSKELELFCINLDGSQTLLNLLSEISSDGSTMLTTSQQGSRTEQPRLDALDKIPHFVDSDQSPSIGHPHSFVDSSRSSKNVRYDSKGHSHPVRIDPHSSASSIKHIKTKRKDTILNFIKSKGEVTIKDICKIKDKTIVSCSEKTIQRDLMSLIKEGVIKREGDKRWTKYSLK